MPLKPQRPIVQFTAFMEKNQLTDALGLGKRIRDHLRDASALGLDAPLVFKARLARGNEKEMRFILEGTRGKEQELIAQLRNWWKKWRNTWCLRNKARDEY